MAAFFLNFLLVVASDFQEKAILLFVYHAQDGLAEGFFPWEGKHLHYVIDRPQADLHLLVVGLAHSIERGLLKVVKRHAATLRKNTAYVSRASRCTSPSSRNARSRSNPHARALPSQTSVDGSTFAQARRIILAPRLKNGGFQPGSTLPTPATESLLEGQMSKQSIHAGRRNDQHALPQALHCATL